MPQQARKVALVTGSTDGVGRRVAERLGGEGREVFVHGRDAERGRAVVGAIERRRRARRRFSPPISPISPMCARSPKRSARDHDAARPSGQQRRDRRGRHRRAAADQRRRP